MIFRISWVTACAMIFLGILPSVVTSLGCESCRADESLARLTGNQQEGFVWLIVIGLIPAVCGSLWRYRNQEEEGRKRNVRMEIIDLVFTALVTAWVAMWMGRANFLPMGSHSNFYTMWFGFGILPAAIVVFIYRRLRYKILV